MKCRGGEWERWMGEGLSPRDRGGDWLSPSIPRRGGDWLPRLRELDLLGGGEWAPKLMLESEVFDGEGLGGGSWRRAPPWFANWAASCCCCILKQKVTLL